MSRWIAPTALAVALGFGALTPAPAQAQDALTRVLVDIADVVFNNGVPYYRYGDYGHYDRLVAARDRYGRAIYYRQVPYGYTTRRVVDDRYGRPTYDRYGRRIVYSTRYDRSGPPYGNAYGYYRNGPGSHEFKARHHRDHDDDNRYWDGRRWRDRDDD